MANRTLKTGLILGLMGMLTAGAVLLPGVQETASAQQQSRLSQLIQRKPKLFLPSRLMIGEKNKFVFQGPVGSHVRLYLSPAGVGGKAPNGMMLRVGENHETMEGVIPENGVLTLEIPVPDEEQLQGLDAFVEAVNWKMADYSDMETFEIIGPGGAKAEENKLVLHKAGPPIGAVVMPNVPGMSSDFLQRLQSAASASGDPNKRELMDRGDINRDAEIDQNPFVNRSGNSIK